MTIRTVLLGLCIVLLCGAGWNDAENTEYEELTENVRLAITYEDATQTKIIGKSIELKDPFLGWFEAEKTDDGSYEYTAKGLAAKEELEQADGDSGGGGGGGC